MLCALVFLFTSVRHLISRLFQAFNGCRPNISTWLASFLILWEMSDTELSDSYLAEEQYDPEDNLNFYGSPVSHRPADELAETSGIVPTAAIDMQTQVSVELFSQMKT